MIKTLARNPYFLVFMFGCFLYVPFAGQPVLRTGGDEKVYIAQALEMAQRGSWFVQTLAGVPSYYKGPLHYILLRIGFLLFGTHSLWAALWANILAVMTASLLITDVIFNRLKDPALAAALGMATLGAGGIYAYVFTSQMEIELVGMYALALFWLDRWQDSRHPNAIASLLWITIGLAGWLKSPLHSALLGIGVFLVAAGDPKLRGRQYSLSGILMCAVGVCVGIAGYAIPWILDKTSFYETYILRETLTKPTNEVAIWETFVPTLTINLWPFMPLGILGILACIRTFFSEYALKSPPMKFTSTERDLGWTALGLSLPTFIFFAVHSYRSAIYTLPCVPAVLILCAIGLGRAKVLWPRLTLYVAAAVPACAALVPGVALIIGWKFGSQALWWPRWLSGLSALTLFGTVGFICVALKRAQIRWDASLLASLPSLIVAGICMSIIGQAEISGLKTLTTDLQKNGIHAPLGYYNLQRHTWSEWGALNLLLGQKVIGLHDAPSLKQSLENGAPVIVPSRKYLEHVSTLVKNPSQLQIRIWPRWQSHAKDSIRHGPLAAWRAGDLSLLQSEAYVVTMKQ
jgi:4-amino-4-deoxy-L-arabinose transferase-like glycosyltransferase